MKLVQKFAILLTLGLVGSPALALEVGQTAPCVVLDHVRGQEESSHCIRDPEIEGQPVFIEFFSITCSDC